MSNSQPFTYGPFTVEMLPVQEIINQVSELPNMLVTFETFGIKCLRLTTDPGTAQAEVINGIRDLGLEGALRVYLETKKGKEVISFTPKPQGLQFHVAYPDFRLGALNSADMKIFAKMSLNPIFELRMFRSKRKTRLENTMGIFGKWTVGDESGVFSIDYSLGNRRLCQVGNKSLFAEDLSREFALRWPMYPKAMFEVLTYTQVQELLTGK